MNIEPSIENFCVLGGFILYVIAAVSFLFKGNLPWALVWGAYAVANLGLIWASIDNK